MVKDFNEGDELLVDYIRWSDGKHVRTKGKVIAINNAFVHETWIDERNDDKEATGSLKLKEEDSEEEFSITLEKSGNHVVREEVGSRSPDGEVKKLEKQ